MNNLNKHIIINKNYNEKYQKYKNKNKILLTNIDDILNIYGGKGKAKSGKKPSKRKNSKDKKKGDGEEDFEDFEDFEDMEVTEEGNTRDTSKGETKRKIRDESRYESRGEIEDISYTRPKRIMSPIEKSKFEDRECHVNYNKIKRNAEIEAEMILENAEKQAAKKLMDAEKKRDSYLEDLEEKKVMARMMRNVKSESNDSKRTKKSIVAKRNYESKGDSESESENESENESDKKVFIDNLYKRNDDIVLRCKIENQ